MINKIADILKYIQNDVTVENYIAVETVVEDIKTSIDEGKFPARRLEGGLIQIVQNVQMSDYWFVYLMSVLTKLFPKSVYVELLLEASLYSEKITMKEKEFILYQVKVLLFQMPELSNSKTSELYQKLYESVKNELRNGVQVCARSKEERNKKQVVVITSQFLGAKHAPTHSTIERSCMLKKMGYDVVILSATEGDQKCIIPYHIPHVANKRDEYNGAHVFEYEEQQFEFYQSEVSVGTPIGLQKVISCVEELNPYFIVYIGGQSYVADILNEFCPVINVATVFSKLPGGNTAFGMVGRKILEQERKEAVSELVEVPFSFEIREKLREHTREELGIPENKFVMAVVGGRLAADVKEEFLNYMQKVDNGFLLLIGPCDNYEQRIQQYPWLKANSVSLGYYDDVLGVLECADLYVNPRRIGGGFSVIEAFHAGIPAVSLKYGDVAIAAGDKFCVDSYEEMLEVICRYQTDSDFYQKQLKHAKMREIEMTDGYAGFTEGIKKILESEKFY